MDERDIVREFLLETNENLARLDNEIVELEQRPGDAALLASIFRTVHTIKGTCGFLGFSALGAIAHETETLLSQMRAGTREASGEAVSLVLRAVDAIRAILSAIESNGSEGANHHGDLLAILQQAASETRVVLPPPVIPLAVREELPPVTSNGNGDSVPSDHSRPVSDSAIRVDVGLLDKLMNLVGELVLARNQILQFNNQKEDSPLNATSQRLNLITTELQESVMKTRMQPIGVVWNKLPRLVRDVAHSLGKQIKLELDGEETELDKTIIEAIKDPLTHLVRNCCDHGIELPGDRLRTAKSAAGRIQLRAYHEGGQVNIEISDDGAGIDIARLRQKAIDKGMLRPELAERASDRELLNLVFLAGLSTADAVTSISGRGVGMDVVKSNIEKIGGTVDVASRAGQGTTVRLKIPLTLAIIPGLVVNSGGERFVIPQVSLLELIRLDEEGGAQQVEYVHGTPVYRRRGSLLPIAHLNEVLRLDTPHQSEQVNQQRVERRRYLRPPHIVVLQAEDRQFGLVVESIHDTQEIVVKPLSKQLKGLSAYAGATIMGDGKVSLILDVVGIGQLSGVLTASVALAQVESQQKAAATDGQRLLLFSAGSFQRLAVPLSLVARLEEFHQNVIEHAGGLQVVQYRDRILQLVSLSTILEPGAEDTAATRDPIQAIVFSDGSHSVGLVVDQILDIVEDTVAIRRRHTRQGLLGSAVVGDRVADFLDLHAILQAVSKDWFDDHAGHTSDSRTVLLAESSPFSRGILRNSLEMAGHSVIEAGSVPEALRALEHCQPDVVVTALGLTPEGGFSLLEAMRRQQGAATLPAVALADGSRHPLKRQEGQVDFDDYLDKFDWHGMIQSVERLANAVLHSEGDPACSKLAPVETRFKS